MIEQLQLKTNIKDDITYYLRNYCYGKENAISKERLAERFGISTRELRKLKREIVLVDEVPIGSTTRGYYFPKDDIEIMQIAKYYKSLFEENLIMYKKYLSIIETKSWRNLL